MALSAFPPKVKEIEEQEVDALKPISDIRLKKDSSQATLFGLPIKVRITPNFK